MGKVGIEMGKGRFRVLRAAAAAVVVALAACSKPPPTERPAPSSSVVATTSAPAPPEAPCERVRREQTAGVAACDATAARARSGVAECQTAPAECLSLEGAWGVVVEQGFGPRFEGAGDFSRWHLVHVPADGSPPRLSASITSFGWPQLAIEAGAIRVRYGHCHIARGASFCEAYATQTCRGVTSGASPLDCPEAHRFVKPAWLPSELVIASSTGSQMAGGTLSWSSSSQSFVAEDDHRWVDLELPSLVPVKAAFSPNPSRIEVAHVRGLVTDSGEVDFDTPEARAWDRAACANAPPPSAAKWEQMWRSAICARLQGKSMPWVRGQWLLACQRLIIEELNGSEFQDRDLNASCRKRPDEERPSGMPDRIATFLESVLPLPR